MPPGGRGGGHAGARAVRRGGAGAVPARVAAGGAAGAARPLAAARGAQRAQAAAAPLPARALRRRRAAAARTLRAAQFVFSMPYTSLFVHTHTFIFNFHFILFVVLIINFLRRMLLFTRTIMPDLSITQIRIVFCLMIQNVINSIKIHFDITWLTNASPKCV